MAYIKNCIKCGASIFFLQDNDGRNIPFEDDVVIIKKGQKYADGFDNIKTCTAEDSGKVKGFLCHFGRCHG